MKIEVFEYGKVSITQKTNTKQSTPELQKTLKKL